MKLVRFGPKGAERPGAIDAEGRLRDLSAHASDFSGYAVSLPALEQLKALDLAGLPLVDGAPRLGPCLADVPNLHCVGLNYVKHAAETGAAKPAEPILFSKATSSISGPFDPVVIPKDSEKTDWEVELGVVIGKRAEHVPEDEALDYVAGYCVLNDVSERSWQIERGGQWVKGKSAPTFAPIGPWLVTADEVADPQNLGLWLKVNDESRQNSSTSDMIFSIRTIIAYMSRFFALRPGDVIATGTPEGVGMGQSPQVFLKPGDVMTLGVEGLGEQRTEVVAAGG